MNEREWFIQPEDDPFEGIESRPPTAHALPLRDEQCSDCGQVFQTRERFQRTCDPCLHADDAALAADAWGNHGYRWERFRRGALR